MKMKEVQKKIHSGLFSVAQWEQERDLVVSLLVSGSLSPDTDAISKALTRLVRIEKALTWAHYELKKSDAPEAQELRGQVTELLRVHRRAINYINGMLA
jgi:hypothetical protein